MKPTIVALVVFAAVPARADEGETDLSAVAALEGALLRHPLAAASELASSSPRVAILPRAGIGVRYGLTNELLVGLGLDGAVTTNVATADVDLGGRSATLLTGTYAELNAPVGLTWRFDSGFDLSGVAALDVAPTIALWYATAPVDPSTVTGGVARRLPLEIDDSIQLGLQARGRLAFDVRVADAISLQTGVHAAVAWAGAPVLRVGILVEAAWIAALGPH